MRSVISASEMDHAIKTSKGGTAALAMMLVEFLLGQDVSAILSRPKSVAVGLQKEPQSGSGLPRRKRTPFGTRPMLKSGGQRGTVGKSGPKHGWCSGRWRSGWNCYVLGSKVGTLLSSVCLAVTLPCDVSVARVTADTPCVRACPGRKGAGLHKSGANTSSLRNNGGRLYHLLNHVNLLSFRTPCRFCLSVACLLHRRVL